jgi:mannose-6-phosphate isomerase-like protein (cupin superfamily)
MIETYEYNAEGYHPFLIRDGWQVAQLNYMEAQDPEKIVKVDMHMRTDEVFILLRGKAILIAATVNAQDEVEFTCLLMRPGITYNIPVHTWHNIAMEKDTSVIIVERNGTHLGDYVYRSLTDREQHHLRKAIRTALQQK